MYTLYNDFGSGCSGWIQQLLKIDTILEQLTKIVIYSILG